VKLSVVIVNYNVRHFLELCLNSVVAATVTIKTEIIVVDNNSIDDSCEMVKKRFPKVLLIENNVNIGFSKANNQGVNNAIGEYVCVLNPDTVIPEDIFIKLLMFSENKEKLGIVSCKLIDGSGAFLPESKRNIPTKLVALKKLLGFSESYYVSDLNENEVGEVPVFVGAFMFLKRSVYELVGGFDERYFMYGEDIDLSYTVLNAGYDNYYCGNLTIIHFKGESTLKDTVYAKRFYGAMQLFYSKYFKPNFLFDLSVKIGVAVIPIIKGLLKDKPIVFRPELVLNTSEYTYKEMICLFEKKDFYYSIRIENTKFTIGSKSSVGKGDVVLIA
jgi:GT2 family glycosyltransferase